MNHAKKLGSFIRSTRKLRGMSLPLLAERAAISKGGLSKIENGKGNPCLTTLISLSKELGISAGHMLDVSFDERQ